MTEAEQKVLDDLLALVQAEIDAKDTELGVLERLLTIYMQFKSVTTNVLPLTTVNASKYVLE